MPSTRLAPHQSIRGLRRPGLLLSVRLDPSRPAGTALRLRLGDGCCFGPRSRLRWCPQSHGMTLWFLMRKRRGRRGDPSQPCSSFLPRWDLRQECVIDEAGMRGLATQKFPILPSSGGNVLLRSARPSAFATSLRSLGARKVMVQSNPRGQGGLEFSGRVILYHVSRTKHQASRRRRALVVRFRSHHAKRGPR